MIDKELVILDSPLENKEEIIRFLSDKASKRNYLTDVETFITAVQKREEEFSTAVGYDISIPHGKNEVVSNPFICFLRAKKPIKWDGNGNYATLIFLLGVPEEHQSKLHLKILAEISKKLMDEQFREQLSKGNQQSIVGLLTTIEENIIKR
ncbi:PTS sugar transporter subunit IIA [Enterococcus olivae]